MKKRCYMVLSFALLFMAMTACASKYKYQDCRLQKGTPVGEVASLCGYPDDVEHTFQATDWDYRWHYGDHSDDLEDFLVYFKHDRVVRTEWPQDSI